MSSTRLPGKVLMPLVGEPMLARQIERVRRAKTAGRLIVATSNDPSDDPIMILCKTRAVACFGGLCMMSWPGSAAPCWPLDPPITLCG